MASADDIRTYLAKHRIHALFNSLTAALAIHRPVDVRSFLIAELKKPRPGSLVTSDEAAAVFDLVDLRKTGQLSFADAMKAFAELDVAIDLSAAKVENGLGKEEFVKLVTEH